jgi:hypothetical protein
MPNRKQIDWFAFWVHFAFGAVIGAVAGLWVWGRPSFHLYDSSLAGVGCIGGGALLGGLLAGVGRESFWESFRR